MRWKWVILGICGSVITMMFGLSIGLLTYDFNRLKHEICTIAKEKTGREIKFGGDIRLEFSLTATLVMNDVKFQNAPWGSEPQMARIKRLEVKVALLPLIFGRVEFRRVVLVNPIILVEMDKYGRSNFEFGAGGKTISQGSIEQVSRWIKMPVPVVNELQVTEGRVTFREGRSGKVHVISVETLRAFTTGCEGNLHAEFQGSYRNKPFKAKGSFGPLAALIDQDHNPWPLSVTVKGLNTTLVLEGTIKDVCRLQGMDFGFSWHGSNLAKVVGQTAGIPFPLKGPFNTSGRVSDLAPGAYRLSNLKMDFPGGSLRGTIEACFSKYRPMIKAVLRSEKLNIRSTLLEDLRSDRIVRERRKGYVFPNNPLPFTAFKHFDAELMLQAGKVLLPGLILNQVNVKGDLKNGRLRIKPFKTLVADGTVEVQLDLQSQGKNGVLITSIKIDHLNTGKIPKSMKGMDVLEGYIDLSIDVWGRGGSIAELMGRLSGKVAMVVRQAKIYGHHIDLMGTDAGSILFKIFDLSKQQERSATPVNCFVIAFNLKNGLADTTALLVETDQVSLMGDGKIDLRTERLDLRLNSIPKKGIGTNGTGKLTVSLGNVVKRFKITGTIAHPSWGIDPEQTALTVGKMIGGTVFLGPFGLLAGFVTGAESESPCSLAKQAAMQGVKMSVLEKQERKGLRLLELPEEGIQELCKGLKKLFGK